MKFPLFFSGIVLFAIPLHAEPQWIWTSKAAKDGEKATFRKTFNVTGAVKSAKIDFTCDNGATVFINGRKVAENTNWDQPTSAKLKEFLKPGENEIRIDARNSGSVAGLVAVEENNTLFVMTSAFAPNALTPVADADITARKPHDVSMMPPGLLNALNPDELLDLYAYILSGGNPEDPRF